MPFFNRFMRRTTGAQAMFLVLTRATKEFFEKLNYNNTNNEENGAAAMATATHSRDTVSSSTARIDGAVGSDTHEGHRVLEAKSLAHVTKALNYALELGC